MSATIESLVTVHVNGEPRAMPAGSTLADLIAALGQPPEAQATAVNGEFVPRGQRGARLLAEGDQVLCFQPIVGG
ncbi:sulfur carrier protein ThiS [Caldimonas tepidiphila]|uniref:sulfur carrier protein ThiS n=1 Tax=Caldimonas tepidiphila TaxID=2315841 RepID=UPI000E5A8590|nr:sulfur carrier protein ThiS [Caldimonas tepidiphila]